MAAIHGDSCRDGSSLCLCGSDGKGAVLFTGPDGVADYKVLIKDPKYIGHGTMSPEGTGDVQYLCRAAKETPHPPPKTSRVGEIGWGVPKLSDNSLLKSGNQIMLKEFRQAAQDRLTHLYQDPYYSPIDEDRESARKQQLLHSSSSSTSAEVSLSGKK